MRNAEVIPRRNSVTVMTAIHCSVERDGRNNHNNSLSREWRKGLLLVAAENYSTLSEIVECARHQEYINCRGDSAING